MMGIMTMMMIMLMMVVWMSRIVEIVVSMSKKKLAFNPYDVVIKLFPTTKRI